MSYWGCIRDTSNRSRYPRGTCLKTPEDLQTRCYGHGSRRNTDAESTTRIMGKDTSYTDFLVDIIARQEIPSARYVLCYQYVKMGKSDASKRKDVKETTPVDVVSLIANKCMNYLVIMEKSCFVYLFAWKSKCTYSVARMVTYYNLLR